METFLIIWLSIGLLYISYSIYDMGYYSLRLLPLTLLGIALGPAAILFGEHRHIKAVIVRMRIADLLSDLWNAKVYWNCKQSAR